MAIIEILKLNDLQPWLKTITIDKYIPIHIHSSNDVVLRPNVTTKGRDTILIRNVSKEIVEKITTLWNEIYECENFIFEEEKMRW
jgi:hypothetical protein